MFTFSEIIKQKLSEWSNTPTRPAALPANLDWIHESGRAGINIMNGNIIILYGEFSVSRSSELIIRLKTFLESTDSKNLILNCIPASMITSVILSKILALKGTDKTITIVHTDAQLEDLELITTTKNNNSKDYDFVELINVGKVV